MWKLKKMNESNVYTMSREDLRGLHEVLFEMLAELDRICKKNNIKYAIDGGTLLGAVRHKGFIPWDDDLDIVMMRGEYDRLRDACKTDLDKSRFFFQDETTDEYYRWGYGRIRRLDSEFVRCGQEHLKMRTGIFIDIFPRDNVPDIYPARLVHAFQCFFWRKVLYSEVGKIHDKNPVKRVAYGLINNISAKTALNALKNLRDKWNSRKTSFVRCYGFTITTRQKQNYGYPREWFESLAEYEFEGNSFPGAKDSVGYLAYVYGDFMKLPPPEQRRWHPCSSFRLPKEANEK